MPAGFEGDVEGLGLVDTMLAATGGAALRFLPLMNEKSIIKVSVCLWRKKELNLPDPLEACFKKSSLAGINSSSEPICNAYSSGLLIFILSISDASFLMCSSF